jgi:Ca-activated chloride channel family protein
MEEFTQTVYAVADDAYLDVSFNPELTKSYRLVGFDNKLKAIADSLNGIQGGEIGSGHSLLALFELDPQNQNLDQLHTGRNGFARALLHYKLPGDTSARTSNYDIPFTPTAFAEIPASYRFAASVGMFGGLLKKSPYLKQVNWEDVIQTASQSYDSNDVSQTEFVALLEKAKKIYARERKKKKQKSDSD